MQVFTEVLTFQTNLGVVTLPDLAGNNYKAAQLFVEPAQANTAVAAVIDTSLLDSNMSNLNQCIIKQLQIPDTAKKVPLDNFQVIDPKGANGITTSQYAFIGTKGQKLNVTIWVY